MGSCTLCTFAKDLRWLGNINPNLLFDVLWDGCAAWSYYIYAVRTFTFSYSRLLIEQKEDERSGLRGSLVFSFSIFFFSFSFKNAPMSLCSRFTGFGDPVLRSSNARHYPPHLTHILTDHVIQISIVTCV